MGKTEEKEESRIEELQDLEASLEDCLAADRRNWITIYRTMRRVEKENLWAARPETRSFTQWVNGLAARMQVHVSLLWARLKAGRTYEEFAQRQASAGRQVPDIESISVATVSPETINLCATVAGKNADKMDALITSAISGELKREDLRTAARAARAARKEAGEKLPTNAYTAIKPEERTDGAKSLTASDVLMAIRRNQEWAGSPDLRPYIPRKYYVFDEFHVATGSSRAARRLDALVAETLTVGEADAVCLIGIEIKVSVSDLNRDRKMQEYTAFVDRFFLAVPDTEEMISAVENVKLPEWGVITVDANGKVKVLHAASLKPGIFRDKTLTAALIKMI